MHDDENDVDAADDVADDGEGDDVQDEGDGGDDPVTAAGRPAFVLGRNLRSLLDKYGLPQGTTLDPDLDESRVMPLVLDRATDVAPAPVEWLWPGRIPLCRLTILA